MLCPQCVQEIKETDLICPYCQTPLKSEAQVREESPQVKEEKKQHLILAGFIGFFVGFVAPIIGLIFCFFYRKENPKIAKAILIGIVASIALAVLLFIFNFITIALISPKFT